MLLETLKRSFPWITLVSPGTMRADALAGLTGAAIVLPQAVAFAAIAGLPPEYGLYTAMVTPVAAALFGSSLVMVSGPTTAISAVVFASLAGHLTPGSPEFIQSAILLALLVGLMQIAFALARVGRLAGFVSHSVMIGFTASAAVLIAVSQILPALGLARAEAHGVIGRLSHLFQHIGELDPIAALVAITTLVPAVLFRVFLPRWPGFLIAIGMGSLVAWGLGEQAAHLAYVGSLPSAFPGFDLPVFEMSSLPQMIESAFAIALIGLLEAIAIGRSLGHRTHTDFSPNREVMGQGLSNAVGSFFQCYPGSGSFTRSGVNLEAGASTPFAAIFAAGFLVAMVAILGPLVERVPIAAVAGLILYVAYKLLDFHEFGHLLKTSPTETGIAGITFLVGLFVNLEFAIYVGTFVSLMVFLRKSALPDLVVGAPDPTSTRRKIRNAELYELPQCPSSVLARLDGPLFFGAVDALTAAFRRLERQGPTQTNLILVLHGVGNVDLAGADLVAEEAKRRRAKGGDVFVVAAYPPLIKRFRRLGLVDELGEDHFFDSKGAAISAAIAATADNICEGCKIRAFTECQTRPGAIGVIDAEVDPSVQRDL